MNWCEMDIIGPGDETARENARAYASGTRSCSVSGEGAPLGEELGDKGMDSWEKNTVRVIDGTASNKERDFCRVGGRGGGRFCQPAIGMLEWNFVEF